MLEKPRITDEALLAVCRHEYGLAAVEITFLPVGADRHSASYRVTAADGKSYFLKLRSGNFREVAVSVPRFLSDRGLTPIIPPLRTGSGALWVKSGGFRVILCPFVEGRDGYDVALSDDQWRELGQTMKQVHTMALAADVRGQLPRETYDPRWRRALKDFVERMAQQSATDSLVAELVSFLASRRGLLLDLLERAERRATQLQARDLTFVLCHTDIHAGNVLVAPGGALYVVDWDEPMLAPKERDLMFIGGGYWKERTRGFKGVAPFYEGYGQAGVDPVALSYFRHARNVEDIVLSCEAIAAVDGNQADRDQSLHHLTASFEPGASIDAAYRVDEAIERGERLR